MPCYTPDPGPSQEEIREAKMPSVLCGILTKYGPSILNGLDWKEIGVSRNEVEGWWRHHKQMDDQRRKREKEMADAESERKQALKKLSAAERKALGLD